MSRKWTPAVRPYGVGKKWKNWNRQLVWLVFGLVWKFGPWQVALTSALDIHFTADHICAVIEASCFGYFGQDVRHRCSPLLTQSVHLLVNCAGKCYGWNFLSARLHGKGGFTFHSRSAWRGSDTRKLGVASFLSRIWSDFDFAAFTTGSGSGLIHRPFGAGQQFFPIVLSTSTPSTHLLVALDFVWSHQILLASWVHLSHALCRTLPQRRHYTFPGQWLRNAAHRNRS